MDWRLVLLLAINVSLIVDIKATIDDETPPQQSAYEKDGENEVESQVKSTCDTLPTKIKVTKEEHDHLGNVIRVCEGSIMVNKCEGTCLSQLKPSVTTATGFLKVLKVLFFHFAISSITNSHLIFFHY